MHVETKLPRQLGIALLLFCSAEGKQHNCNLYPCCRFRHIYTYTHIHFLRNIGVEVATVGHG